jgi:hypothetical protein
VNTEDLNLTQYLKVFLVGNNNIAADNSNPSLMKRASVPSKYDKIHRHNKKGKVHIGGYFSVKPI